MCIKWGVNEIVKKIVPRPDFQDCYKSGKIELCQRRPGNVREIVPISENVRVKMYS